MARRRDAAEAANTSSSSDTLWAVRSQKLCVPYIFEKQLQFGNQRGEERAFWTAFDALLAQ